MIRLKSTRTPSTSIFWGGAPISNDRLWRPCEFVRRVCELADFDFEVLASKARDRDTAGKRRIIATLGVERWRQKGTELAAVLKKNQDVVSWWVGEGVRRRLEDKAFAAEIDRLDKELSALLTSSGR